MTDNIVNLTARRATQAEFDADLIRRLEQAIFYVEQGIDVAKEIRSLDPGDESDGLIMMRRTLGEAAKRLEQLSPHLGG